MTILFLIIFILALIAITWWGVKLFRQGSPKQKAFVVMLLVIAYFYAAFTITHLIQLYYTFIL